MTSPVMWLGFTDAVVAPEKACWLRPGRTIGQTPVATLMPPVPAPGFTRTLVSLGGLGPARRRTDLRKIRDMRM